MPHDVPWAIEQGLHSAAVARQIPFVASQGQEGLTDPLDCRVSALDIPGPYVKVGLGSYNILNRGPQAGRQMYSGRLSTPDQVAINPTSSTGGRTDLIIVRVENPDVDGTAPPTSRDNGPYVFTRAVAAPAGAVDLSGVTGGSNWSALVLARVTIPANTATITNAMITDLRSTKASPTPAAGQFVDVQNFASGSTLPPPAAGSGVRFSSWIQWPVGASWQIPVPGWATEVSMYYSVNPYLGDNTWGGMSIDFNGRWSPEVVFDVNFPLISTTQQRCIYTNAGGMRTQYTVGATTPVTAADRGRTVPVRVMARTFDSYPTYQARGASYVDRGSVGYFSAFFKQAATAA